MSGRTDWLTEYDIKMLEVLDGKRELDYWGAWCTAVLEDLSAAGLCSKGPKYEITDWGREVLAELEREKQ